MRFSIVISTLLCLTGSCFLCQTALRAEEKNPALKYHTILRKRPEPGYLFDRFYNTWLDHSTAESLQDFLKKKVDEKDTTSNRLLLAFFHTKQNDDVAAIDEFAAALKRDPGSAAAWYYKARAESRTLDYEAAVSDLKEARRHKPDDKLAIGIDRLLGTVLMRNQQTKEAIAVWKGLLDAHPTDEELFEDVIELHLEESLFDEAVALSEALIAKTKDPYIAVMRRLRLGDIHHRAGRREKAVEVYASALGDSGTDSWLEREILAQIEQLFRLEDDLTGLKKQYVELLNAYPKRIGLHRRRCRLSIELGENDEALKGYRKILELTPGDRGFREEYVAMLSRLGRHDEAVKELKALCGQNPKDAELQVRLAKILHQAKKTDEAIEAVRQYLKNSDGGEYAHTRAARLVEGFGDKPKALEFFRKLSETFADSPSAQEAYAGFLYANDRKPDALAIWKKLAEKADVNLTLNIVRALCSRGENGVALELLTARQKDFGDNPLFLGQLVNVSLHEKKYVQCLPGVKRRVELARSVSELEAAVSQAVTAFKQSDKIDEAIEELEAAQDRPIQMTCLLSELLESIGDSIKADAVLKNDAEQGDKLAIGQQIRLCCLRGNWSAAATATKRLLELSGGGKSQHVRRLVELYERDFKLDEALKWTETWKRLSPGSTDPWLTEARLLQFQGKEDEAQNALRKAIQRFDKDEDIRATLAQAYSSAGKYREAERVYRQLFEKTEDVSSKLRWVSELADIAESEGTVSQLVEEFEQRRRGNRRSIVPLLALAEIHHAADDYEGRRQALLAATNLKPDDIDLLTHIARIEENEGDWKAAVATLERAAKFDKTGKSRQKIARLHLEYGNPEDGFAMLRGMLDEQNTDPRAIEGMADALCGIMEWDRAANLLRDRISAYPGDYRLRYLLAVTYEEAGRFDEAIAEFVRLLDNQEELPTVKKSTAKAMAAHQSGYDVVKGILPPAAIQMFDLMEKRGMAYYHRENRGSRIQYSSHLNVSSFSSTVFMPSFVEDVHPLALAHLLALSKELDEAGQTALAAEMKSRGVRSPKMLLELGDNMERGLPVVSELLNDNPDDELLLAVAVLSGFDRSEAADAELLVRAFEKFRRNHQELAFIAAVQAASRDKKHAPLLDRAIELAAKIERPNPLLVAGTATALGSEMFGHSAEQSLIEKKQRDQLVKLMLGWYPGMSQGNTPYGPYIFFCVVGVLRTGDDPLAYFSFLADEVARHREKANKPTNSNRMGSPFYGRQEESLLKPLGFPPEELTDFPANIRGIISPDDNDPFSRMLSQQSKSPWEPEKLKPLVEKVKYPALRLLLAHQYGYTEMVDVVLKEMLAERAPRLDAYLLAAGKAGTEDKYAETVQLLEKARHLPMKKREQQRIDAAMVAAVLSAKENQKADEDLLKAGRDAALRLRRQRLDKSQREQLVLVLSDLGLKKEAENLEKRNTASFSSGPSFSGRAFVSPGSTSPTDRIEELIAQDKIDLAARMLANNLKSIGQQIISNPGNSEYYTRQAKELTAQLAELQMLDVVLKQFEPGDSKNPIRIREYGLACELLGKNKKAREAYKQVLVQRPKDDMARARLIMLMEDSPPADLDEHLEKLADSSIEDFGQMLSSVLNDYETDWNKRFRCAEIALRLLPKLKDRPRADTGWVERVASFLGHNLSSNQTHFSLPSLYDVTTYDSNRDDHNNNKQYAKELARKTKLHRDLCLLMLDVPDLARSGFQNLLAAAEARGDVPGKGANAIAAEKPKKPDAKDSPKTAAPQDTPEDFRRFAEKVLIDESAQRHKRGQSGVTYYFSANDPDNVQFRSPEEYLVSHAWKSNDWRRLDEELLPKLAEGRNKQPHKTLAILTRLYRCPAEEFLAAAEKVVKDYASSSFASRMDSADGLLIVVEVWAARALNVDLEPMVMKSEKSKLRGRSYPNSSAAISRYLEILILQGQLEKARNILAQMAELYLGPEPERITFIKKHYMPQNVTYGTPNGRIHCYVEFLSRLTWSETLVFPALEQLEPLSDVLPWNGFNYQVGQRINPLLTRKPEKVLATLAMSPWLDDLEHFRVWSFGDDIGEWPLVEMLEHARNYLEDESKPFWKALEESQNASPTFGKGLLLAAAAQESENQSLLEYLGKHIGEIKKLPQERQDDLAAFANRMLRSDLTKNPKAAKSETARWMAQCRTKRFRKCLEKFEKAKRLEDLGANESSSWEGMIEALANMIPEDPQTAKKVFLRMISIIEDYTKRNGNAYFFYHRSGVGSGLLENVIDNGNPLHGRELTVFTIDLLSSPEGEGYYIDNSLHSSIRGLVWGIHNRNDDEEEVKKEKLSVEAAMSRFHQRLGETLNGRSAALLIPHVSSVMNSIIKTPEDRDKTLAWAKREMKSGKYPALAADMLACALRMRRSPKMDEKSKDAKTSDAADAEANRPESLENVEYFRKQIADEKVPFVFRLEIAGFMVQSLDVKRMPAELARDIAALYVAAIEKGVLIEDSDHRYYLNILSSLRSDPGYEVLFEKWKEQSAHRYLRVQRTSRNVQSKNPSISLNDSTVISQALALYLSADDTDKINLLLKKYAGDLSDSPSGLAQLVRYGKIDLASRLFRKQISAVNFEWSDFPIDYYRKDIPDNLPEFLAKIPKEDDRLFAEIMLATMPTAEEAAKSKTACTEFPFVDADKEEPKADDHSPNPEYPGSGDRLAALVERYKKTEFRNKSLKTRALSGLLRSRKAAAMLAEEVATEYKECGIVIALHNGNNRRMQELQPVVLLHIANRLVENDLQPFIETLDRLAKFKGNSSNFSYYLYGNPAIEACMKSLDKENVRWSVEQSKAISEALFAFPKNRNRYYGGNSELNTLLLLSFYRAGRLDELRKLPEGDSESLKAKLCGSIVMPSVWKKLKKMPNFPAEGETAKRVEHVRDVLQVIFQYRWFHWSTGHIYGMCRDDVNLFERIVKDGLLSEKEMIEHGPAIVEKLEKAPLAKACMASWLLDKKEYKKAEPLWRSAIAEAPKESDLMKNYWNYGLYNTLEALGQRDDAKKVLKLVDMDKIQ